MFRKITLLMVFSICLTGIYGQEADRVRIGVMTDVQYCDCPSGGVRQYRLSLAKLDTAVTVFNQLPLQAVFHLGDITDRYAESIDSVLPRFAKLKAPLNLILGNHEYMIAKELRPSVQKRVGLKEPYYTYDIGQWQFIILNGNDLSFFAPQTREQRKERNEMVLGLYGNFRFSGLPWNGGIGSVQMNWLRDKLAKADSAGKRVIVMCHFPIFGKQNHILFNYKEMRALLSLHPSVKAYFCGHYHDGGYAEFDGVHMVNFKGMVNTGRTAFSEVTLTADSILIKGYGREPDRKLKIR